MAYDPLCPTFSHPPPRPVPLRLYTIRLRSQLAFGPGGVYLNTYHRLRDVFFCLSSLKSSTWAVRSKERSHGVVLCYRVRLRRNYLLSCCLSLGMDWSVLVY